MGKKIRQIILTLVMVILLLGPFNLISCADQPSPCSSFSFMEDEDNGRWLGTFDGSVKSDKIRISLYDVHMNLKETGLVSEYFENTTEGYFIELRDSNENSKLDATDKFIIHSRGEVQPNWGVILTYETTGQTVASAKLSYDNSMQKEDNEDEYNPGIYLLLLEYHICALAIFLAIYHVRRR